MKFTAFLLVALLLTQLALAKPPADTQARLDAWIKDQSGGVTVAWVDAEGVMFFQSGKYSADDPRPVTPDTQFEMGSVTKVFTALLLTESERLGKVSRNDPAAKYLLPPDDPAQSALAKITLLSLTTHTSGLRNMPTNFGMGLETMSDPFSTYDRAALIKGLRDDGPEAVALVGRTVSYSNFGVSVLGEALASAWGKTYAEALREHVLAPLGLKSTSLGIAGSTPPANLAPGNVKEKRVPNWTFLACAGAGALRSSARDMAAFLTACLGGADAPLHEAIIATIQPQYADPAEGGKIGLGWMITNDKEKPVYWHGGATVGSHTFVAFSPKTGVGLAILANVQEASEPLGFALIGGNLALPPPKEITLPIETLREYVGSYPLAPQFALAVTEENGALFVQGPGGEKLNVFATAKDEFFCGADKASIKFQRDGEGKVAALVLHLNGLDKRLPRGKDFSPSNEIALPVVTLREYVGEYPLTQQVIFKVTETDGTLFAQLTGQANYPVFATAKDEFFYKVVDARLSFERDAAGKVAALVLHQSGIDRRAPRGELAITRKEAVLPIGNAHDFIGSFSVSPAFVLVVTEQGGALFVQATAQPQFPIFASAGTDEFFYKVVDAQISFQRDEAGKVISLVLHQAGRDLIAKKTAN